jgi:uncharacterized glyoxalase superfamily protein PhnB
MRLTRVTILVRDQDETLRWLSEKLGFKKMADERIGPSMRWLTVAPEGQSDLEIVLLKPDPAVHGKKLAQELTKRIGKGTSWVLQVDDCQKTFNELRSRGVKFTAPPTQRPYGLEALFNDLYGNPWVLIQPK